jgi:hypothetical protein
MGNFQEEFRRRNAIFGELRSTIFLLTNNSIDLLCKSNNLNPTLPKLRFISSPEERGGVGDGVLGIFARGLKI